MDVLDSLTDEQRGVLQQFQSITNTEDLDTAVVVLQSAEWDLETAITKIYDRPTGKATSSGADVDDDNESEDRPLMHDFGIDDSDVMPPSGTGRGVGSGPGFWLRQLLAIPLHILSWPLGIFYGSAGFVLGFVARLLHIRPGVASFRPRNPFIRDPNSASARRRLLDPTAAAERWVRALEEVVGSRAAERSSSSATSTASGGTGIGEASGSGLRSRNAAGRTNLPDFIVGGYEDALRRAKEELKVLMVVLTCEEHDDDAPFKRNVLTDPDFLRALSNERILCWGGDIRDRDAYQVSKTLHPYAYPFITFISLQPTSRPGSSSSSPQMASLTRHEGPPSSSTSSQTLLTSLTTIVLPRSTPFLTRLRTIEASRKAERRIREEQDRAFAIAAAKDTERVLRKRKEEAEKTQSAQIAEEREEEKRRKSDERKRIREMAGRWREWQRTLLEAEGEPPAGVRVGVRLGDGRRVVRKFDEESRVERVYAWVECCLGEPGDEKVGIRTTNGTGRAKKPVGYDHVYDFRLATTFPRILLEVDGSAANEEVGKVAGGVLKGAGANLVVEGLEKRRESLGEVGSDEEDESEEEEEEE
ncbi:FAS-associated factor 2, partial [Phenoliferia sp. Uapishka_3]